MRGRWEGSHDGGQDDLGGENRARGGEGSHSQPCIIRLMFNY